VLAEQRREIVARKVALKSATTQAGEFVHEEIRKVRRVFGPTHAIEISNVGLGRFNHWRERHIIFSSSDSTDPRSNGRRYWAVVPYEPMALTTTGRASNAPALERLKGRRFP
jgi:hypothetical protein